jgi:NitT/TauT family transport system ATP-binding protein
MSSMIQVQHISLAYGPRPVLEDISLDIHPGEFVCVLGQTGCGKSSLLRLLLGSERPSRGQILIDGVEHRQPDRSRGYVPQKYALFPDRTVMDNITFGPELSEFSLLSRLTPRFYRRRKELRAQAVDYIRRIGLREADADKYPDQLSGGMQQRVAVAQALMTGPRILLMDEAFSALDPGTRREMQQLIRELWRSTGTTVLFVTHHTEEAIRMGSRVVVLAKELPDRGSRIVLDHQLPESLSEGDIPNMIGHLESVSEGRAEWMVGSRLETRYESPRVTTPLPEGVLW